MMCGEAADGALGCGDTGPDRPTPQLIHALISMEVTDVALGTYHAVAITASPRSMYAWGRPGRGRLGLGPITNEKKCITTPQPVSIPDKGVISRVTCGRSSTMVLFTGGQLYACGDNRANKLGLDSRPGVLRTLSHRIHKVDVAWYLTRVHSVGKVRVKTMASGPSFGGAVSTGGNLFMYGKNAVGGLGCGDTTEIKQGTASEVRSILVGRTVRAVACGETFAVAAADDDPELPLVGDVKVKHSKPKTLCAQKIFAWGQGMVCAIPFPSSPFPRIFSFSFVSTFVSTASYSLSALALIGCVHFVHGFYCRCVSRHSPNDSKSWTLMLMAQYISRLLWSLILMCGKFVDCLVMTMHSLFSLTPHRMKNCAHGERIRLSLVALFTRRKATEIPIRMYRQQLATLSRIRLYGYAKNLRQLRVHHLQLLSRTCPSQTVLWRCLQ
mmetsp:Transcript_712/g.2310  ORF Transcript_712/g.2310 Transcript_712/m.2310 type:complete len:440 (+) Transcript_712:2444-3763(+)